MSLGDSYISGEAGRWAGNTARPSCKVYGSNGICDEYYVPAPQERVDALGENAYHDLFWPSREEIVGCHRSQSAEVHIGIGTLNSKNFACSGAKTSSQMDGSFWKPGIDPATWGPAGGIGQTLALQSFAIGHDVKIVLLSIGGNDFGFGGIVKKCIAAFLGSLDPAGDLCKDDTTVVDNLLLAAEVTGAIESAVQNVATAMTNAGRSRNDYTIVLQTYPSPLPKGSLIRYADEYDDYPRHEVGACGIYNDDATWLNDHFLATVNEAVLDAAKGSRRDPANPRIRVLDVSRLFDGHRLCEVGVGLIEDFAPFIGPVESWAQPGAADATEWVAGIRGHLPGEGFESWWANEAPVYPGYTRNESVHPNYWGQLALRNCARQVAERLMDGARPTTFRTARCWGKANGGTNSRGEPNVTVRYLW